MKKLLSLGSQGKLVVKSSEGKELPVSPNSSPLQKGQAIAYLLVDCSTSMTGQKIEQAKRGALDFAKTAIRKGYLLGLIKFDSSAELLCEPTATLSLISNKVKEFTATADTNLTEALKIAAEKLIGKRGYRVVVVATDGCPNDPVSALKIAQEMKKDKIEILAISTEDADQVFLSELVSRKDLNLKLEQSQFREGMNLMAKKLPFLVLEHKR